MPGSGVELLFGPLLIGVILSTLTYGVMSVQMLVYFQTYKSDARWDRYFMMYLFCTETVNLLVEIGIIYEPLIIRYGAERALIISPLLLPGDAISITTALNFIPDFPLSKLYTISLLSTLNARAGGRSADAENRLPNALFNESSTPKTTTHTTQNSILGPKQYANVYVYPNTYQSPNDQDVTEVSLKDMGYPPDMRT
ncbi:hypothetical protein MSAN_02366200 [Mycena sanguinolenta]|uniref:Uncharacterized protein n=1 Tax=Mycena sanguinolenta TaxID=230812 RepID=A0A8H7CFT4_9AGAR|nr:hypothetical protein MSAN_02366200 [Mycena sanguinolenta]